MRPFAETALQSSCQAYARFSKAVPHLVRSRERLFPAFVSLWIEQTDLPGVLVKSRCLYAQQTNRCARLPVFSE